LNCGVQINGVLSAENCSQDWAPGESEMEDVVLITGGAGFIGCHLAAALGVGGRRIIVVDNLHPQVHPDQSRPKHLPDHAQLIIADVADSDFWDTFLDRYRPEIVFHLAAETGTGQSLTYSARHARVNVLGVSEMLDSFTRAKVIPEHLVLTSSRAVYGEGAWISGRNKVFYPIRRSREHLERACWGFRGPDGDDARPIPQSASSVRPEPTSVYGATKLTQEQILSAWASAMKVPLTIFRLQNVYGPGQSPYNPYTGIVTLFHRVARSGGIIDVYEDGLIGRDFVFVSDVVAACLAAIENPSKGIRILDVGTGVSVTILEAANIIAGIYGSPSPVISGKFRDGDVRWAVCDPDALLKELGVRAKVGFAAEGAQITGEWLASEGII
jgi:dTDP-L-rhamnose 4-epimerase